LPIVPIKVTKVWLTTKVAAQFTAVATAAARPRM
jgi:hypothetical protein